MTPLLATLTLSDFLWLGWIGLICAGAASSMNREPASLRRIERKLDALLKHQGVPTLPKMSEAVKLLAADPTKKIAAIKLYREESGLGLAEAKSDIEEYLKSVQ